MVVERIEGTPERALVQRAGFSSRSDEPRDRFLLEKVGSQGQVLVHKAEPVEDHNLDRWLSSTGAMA